MKARIEEGKVIKYSQIPQQFTAGSKIIAGGGRNLPTEKLEEYGFFDVVTPTYDPRIKELGNIYFDSTNSQFTYPVNNKTWTETLAELKTQRIAEARQMHRELLDLTDGYVTRKYEKGTAIPSDIQTERDGIRTAYENHKTSINAKTTKAQIMSYNITY